MLGTVGVLAMLMLGGFLLSLKQMSPLVEVLAFFSPVRWAYEALLDVEFHGVPKGGFMFTAHGAPGERGGLPLQRAASCFLFAASISGWVREVGKLLGAKVKEGRDRTRQCSQRREDETALSE